MAQHIDHRGPEISGSTSTQTSERSQPERPEWKDLPLFESRNLFGPRTEIGIVHEGALYRLKITRQGKLVLNK